MKMRKLTSKQREILLSLVCTGGVLSSAFCGVQGVAEATTISNPPAYTGSAIINDDVQVVDGKITNAANVAGAELIFNGSVDINGGYIQIVNAGTKYTFNGDVSIKRNTTETEPYALFANGASGGSEVGTITINSAKNKTVQIEGDIKASLGERIFLSNVNVTANFSNKDSFFAGKLLTDDVDTGNLKLFNLDFSNGATWYIQPEDAGYAFGDSYNITSQGGVIDTYHTSPTASRSTVGEAQLNFGGVKDRLNGTTFVISSDVVNNKADNVMLNDSEGGNTYYVQVVHDASDSSDGTFVATDKPVVLNIQYGMEEVTTPDKAEAKSYTLLQEKEAGLVTKETIMTPTLELEEDLTVGSSYTRYMLTGVDVKTTETPGPAQEFAGETAMAAAASMASWRAENNDLQKRMGDLRREENNTGIWARYYGGESEIKSSNTNLKYHGIQAGFDRQLPVKEGKLFTGIAVSQMKGDYSASTASGDTESNLVGIYGSYLGNKGHFADLIIKYGRLSNDTSSFVNGDSYKGDTASRGLNMSLEYGYHQKLKDGLYIEPLAELNYGHISGDTYTMVRNGVDGASVSNDAISSFIGKLGMNIGKETKMGNVYLKMALLHEFDGEVGVHTHYGTYSKDTTEDMKDTWFEYGLGFNQSFNKNLNLYGEVAKAAGGDKINDKWKANIGLRYSF